MIPFVSAVVMFGVGVGLAVFLNAEFVANVAQTKTRSPESAMVMAWMLRAALILLPIAFAIVGALAGPELFEEAA